MATDDPTLGGLPPTDPYAGTIKGSETGPTLPGAGAAAPVPAEVADALPSARFGRFVRTQKLGEGGMGEVWKAWDSDLRRWVALKFLKATEDREIIRFQREAQTAGRLVHPNIAAIYDVGETQGSHWIAMQFVDGRTLKSFPRADRRRLVEIVRDAARGLAHAHAAGLIHRDIKPDNIMVDRDGRAYLMDFGLARPTQGVSDLTVSGMILGTIPYMSPEQTRVETLDARTDLWSLGAVLYEILTGRRPFNGSSVAALFKAVQETDPPAPRGLAPSIDRDLETIMLACLEKDPAQRCGSASLLAGELDRWLAGEPSHLRRVSAVERLWRRVRRNRPLTAAVTASIVLLLGGGTALIVQRMQSSGALARKDEESQRTVAQLKRLSTLWMKVIQGKQDLRRLAVPVAKAREDLVAAVAAIDLFARENPSLPQGCYLRARGRLYLLKHKEALADVDQALKLAPDFYLARRLKGMILIETAQSLEFGLGGSDDARGREMARLTGLAVEEFKRAEAVPEDSAARWGLTPTAEDDVLTGVAKALALLDLHHDRAGAVAFLKSAIDRRMAEEYAAALGMMHDNEWLAKSIEWAPGYAWPRLLRGTIRMAEGQRDEAITDFTEVIRLEPDSVVAYCNRGGCRELQGRHDEALADFEAALRIDPANVSARGNRAMILADRGELDRAIREYDEAIRLDPRQALLLVNRGSVRSASGDLDGAKADYEKALELDPLLAAAYNNRGALRRKLGDPDGAMSDFNECLRLDARFMGAYDNRGALRHARRDFAGAIKDYDEALKLEPGYGQGYMNRATTRRKLGDWKGALRDLDEAIRRGLDSAAVYDVRGQARCDAGDPKGAIRDFDAAIARDQGYSHAFAHRGTARDEDGDPDGALRDLDQAIRLNSTCSDHYYHRGGVRAGADDREGAMSDYNEAIRLEPAHAEAHVNRGALRQEQKDLDGALEDYEAAIRADATLAPAFVNRGGVRWIQGNLDGALEDFNEAVRLDPNRPEAYLNRGMVHERKGDLASAVTDYEECLRVAPPKWPGREKAAELLRGAKK